MKFQENSKNWKGKLLQLKQAKFSLIKLLKNLKKNMIRGTFFLLNGKKLPKLLQEEMKILIKLGSNSQGWWTKLMQISKLWIKEKNNLIVKKDSIVKRKLRTFLETETLVIERMNLNAFNSKELLTSKLKSKFWKINFLPSQQN